MDRSFNDTVLGVLGITMERRRILLSGVLVVTGFCCLPGCATIVSDSKYDVTFDNNGGPTQFEVRDRKNQLVHQGMTPQQVKLKARSSPFQAARYDVTFKGIEDAVDQQTIKAKVDPWLAGNLIAGGLIGLTVDGFSGAMFKLPERSVGTISEQYASGIQRPVGANVANREQPSEIQKAGFVAPHPGAPNPPGIAW